MKLTPTAVWRTRAWPPPGSPTVTASQFRTSGPPVWSKRMACGMSYTPSPVGGIEVVPAQGRAVDHDAHRLRHGFTGRGGRRTARIPATRRRPPGRMTTRTLVDLLRRARAGDDAALPARQRKGTFGGGLPVPARDVQRLAGDPARVARR